MQQDAHATFMRAALEIAQRGMAAGEPPVGAVVVHNGRIVARAHNSVISQLDVTAHAEVVALRESCHALRKLRLDECVLYSTVEPCPMCLAASFYSGVKAVYFGSSLDDMQTVTGRELSGLNLGAAETLKQGGILGDECCA